MRMLGNSVGSISEWIVAFALAAPLGLTACEDKKPPPVVTTESAKPAAEPIVKRPIGDLVAPPEVVLFGGIEDVAKVADPISEMAAMANPGAPKLSAQLPKIATETLGLGAPDGLDFAKPVRIAILDPKKHVRGFGVFMLHVKSEEALLATAPPTRAINDQGNAYGWDIQGGRVYLNLVGDVAVFTMEPTTFAQNQAFLKELTVATGPAGATFIARAANLVTLYGGDFEQALGAMKTQQGSLSGPAAQGLANVIRLDQGVFDAMKELDTITISLRPSEDGLVMSYGLMPRAGTPLDATFKSLKPKGDNALLARFPKNTAAYVEASLSPESLQSMKSAMTWILSLSLPPEQADRFIASWSEIVAASTGDFVVGGFKGKDGFMIGGMSGISDSAKAKAAQADMLKMYDDPAMKSALEAAGVKATVNAKAYKIGEFDVATTKSELKNMPPGAAAAAALSPFLETHAVVTKDAALVAYGPNAKDTLKMLVEGRAAKDAPELGLDSGPGAARAKKNGAANAFMHLYLVPSALSGGGPGDGAGILITVGAKDGLLEISLDVPTAQIAPTMMALSALRGLGGALGGPAAPGGPAPIEPAGPKGGAPKKRVVPPAP